MVSIQSGSPASPTVAPDVSKDSGQPAAAWLRWLGKPAIQRVLSVIVVLAAWQLIGSHFPYSMSSPGAIARATGSSLVSQVLPAFAQTLESFGLGLGISIVVGIPVGLAMARVKVIRVALEPYVLILYSMPMLALIPILIIIFGISFQLRVAGVVLFGIFAIIVNTFSGASRVDPRYEDVGRSFMAGPWKRLTSIIIPASLRYIFAGIRIGFGHAMIGAVVIEIEASAVGMGYLLTTYIQELHLGQFFVVVIVLGIFSILCSIALRWIEHWCTEPWSRTHRFALSRRRPASAKVAVAAPTATEARPVSALAGAAARVLLRLGAWSAALARSRPAGWLRGSAGAWLIRVVVLAAILGYWQLASQSISRAVLPSPGSVADAIYQLTVVNHQIFRPLLSSLALLAAGFGLAVALGIPLGLAMGRFRWFENVTDPYVSFLYALPHVVFVPLMVVWLGFGFNFGLAYVTLSAIFPVIINTMQGVKAIDQEYIDTGRSFCASQRTIMRTIVIPGATPFMVTGARLAFSVSWIGVIISEVLSSQTGLGGMIDVFSNNYQTADMFVPVVFIAVISVIILQLSTRYQPRLTPWHQPQS
jgi:ABC-type nitrate/sulfonate/bicarbonate transport system permease component